MATVTAPKPGASAPQPGLEDFTPRLPARLQRVPAWLWIGGGLVTLMALSALLRSRYLSGQYWMDEAITTGVSLHSLSAIPGVLRHDGNPPLYYMALHIWMSVFGSTETATHSLSLLFGVLTVPTGGWAAWSLFGRRAGIMAALLFAFNAWLTAYAQETRMYELMGLLGVLATAGFVHGFVYRRRRFLFLFGAALTLMLYTHSWGTFFFAGSAISLIPTFLASDDRRGLLRDAVITFATAGILYLPWLPTLIYQLAHTTAPWHYAPLLGATVPSDLLGGERVDVVLLVAGVIGLAPLLTRAHRRTPTWSAMWALLTVPVAGLVLARALSIVTTAWVARYFAPMLATLLLLAALACARARVVGLVAIGLAVLFLANPSSFTPQYKSDMRDVGAEMGPLLHQGDLVVVGQPEQTTLAWYYLPAGLRYANTAGVVADPRYMNWVDALKRLKDTQPQATLGALVANLKPGQQLLYVRPLTEGAQNWEAPWTQLVRRRSAQWGQVLTNDVTAGTLKPVAVAPHNYRGACCVANSAMLYQKAS
jgi:uncharacterized membrane protein